MPSLAMALAACAALAPVRPARAAIIRSYNVGDIAVGVVPHQVPAINNLGQVSFLADGGVDLWNGSAVVQLPTPGVTGFKANTAINDSGVVAFTTGLAEYTTRAAGPLVTVANAASLPPGTIVSSPSINNAGTVVFTGGTYPFGTTGAISLFRGSTAIASIGNYDLGEISPRPSINSAGAIVITGRAIGGQRTGVYFATDSGLTPIVTSNAFGDSFGDAAINSTGVLAVAHSPLSGTKQLLVGTAAPPALYADSTGSFSTFQDETGYSEGNVSLNALGDLAFLAYTKPYNGSASGGIFTGTDPTQNAIVRAGDPLDGSTIKQLDFGPFGLNDAGQVTFWAQLADGRTGVYLATPTPEPTSLAAAAIGAIACATLRRRSKKPVPHARA